jgi:hypothetical protein
MPTKKPLMRHDDAKEEALIAPSITIREMKKSAPARLQQPDNTIAFELILRLEGIPEKKGKF